MVPAVAGRRGRGGVEVGGGGSTRWSGASTIGGGASGRSSCCAGGRSTVTRDSLTKRRSASIKMV